VHTVQGSWNSIEGASLSTTLHTHPTAIVNAYLLEGERDVVAVDGTLTVSDGRALRARVEALGKPLRAVVVTHAHPDHYGGIVELVGPDAVPILAVAGVDEAIRRDDDVKEQILRPMFGDEWPRERRFPTDVVADGDVVSFGDISLRVTDLGPGESPHDSMWTLVQDGPPVIFAGDVAYDHTHAYLADGHFATWLEHLQALRASLPADTTLHIGHGGPATVELLGWQEGYIERFVAALRAADWAAPEQAHAAVVGEMRDYLDTDALQFLMELSIEPLATKLGLR
jgi:glyoxylase-like metal-dependent hydrolase (beta-lactamase superfamily II)